MARLGSREYLLAAGHPASLHAKESGWRGEYSWCTTLWRSWCTATVWRSWCTTVWRSWCTTVERSWCTTVEQRSCRAGFFQLSRPSNSSYSHPPTHPGTNNLLWTSLVTCRRHHLGFWQRVDFHHHFDPKQGAIYTNWTNSDIGELKSVPIWLA